jgi:hypothetical protein
MKEDKNNIVLEFIKNNPNCYSGTIFEKINVPLGLATIKRILFKNIELKYVEVVGKGKNTRYRISDYFQFLYPINVADYFKKKID